MITFEDATNSADERVDYPDYVDGFRRLGFEQIGRVLARPKHLSMTAIAESYGEHRATVFAHMTTPTPVLRSPNTPAFADVSWFCDSPSVRIRTHLKDGYLIETLRRWDNPPWDRPFGTIDKIMLKNHAPRIDRSTRLVTSSSSVELWAAHHEHVTETRRRRKAAPVDHVDLADFIALSTATFERDRRYRFTTVEKYPAGQNRPARQVSPKLAEAVRNNQLPIFIAALVAVWVVLAVVQLVVAFT